MPEDRVPVEQSDTLACLFSAHVSDADGGYVIEIPTREIEAGAIGPGDSYRVALIDADAGRGDAASGTTTSPDEPQPPVEPGEIRYVEIEDLGKQGDGIARVERGYVIIVPESTVGDRMKIEITDVEQNFAVGEIIETT